MCFEAEFFPFFLVPMTYLSLELVPITRAQAMKDVATQYRWTCSSLPALNHVSQRSHALPGRNAGSGHGGGKIGTGCGLDLFQASGTVLHLSASRAAGVFMLARPSSRSHAAAVAHITRLDPPSQGIGMGKVCCL